MSKTTAVAKPKKKKKILWKRVIPFYIMALPGLIYLFVNNYMPLYGLLIAFKDLNFKLGIMGSPWVGLDNFKFLFASPDGFIITRNTIVYNVVFWVVGTFMSITMAILINEIVLLKVKKVYQSLILLPYIMSWVIVNYMCYAFLAPATGMVNNQILKPLGFAGINWYAEKKYWPFILVFFHVWKGVGYSLFIYLSSIVGISADYYEAARIDGASKLQQIRYITLPLIKPTVIVLFILACGGVMRSDFGLFYQLPRNSGLLYDVTRTLDVYVYQALMQKTDYQMSSAAAFYQSIVGFILILGANQIVRKVEPNSAFF